MTSGILRLANAMPRHGLDPQRHLAGARRIRLRQVHGFEAAVVDELQGTHGVFLRPEAFSQSETVRWTD